MTDGGGTVTYTYTQNDVLSAVGPAPSGENTKRRQFEYDGLGRLTSVCELTSLSGSGSCAKASSQPTGYWTKYSYDLLGDVIGVTQNAQSSTTQTRTFTYDLLTRLTSESNPESGTTSYTYDTDSTCGTYRGDLVKRVDAVGNTTCYAYDALHRATSVTYRSGPYSASTITPTKCYVYDSATVNGQTMANAKGRQAEAYTTSSASCPGTGKITDIGFSYSVRGELADVYESTPHSGGYYHSTASYWANGGLHTLNPLNNPSALPTITYGVDGEGRPNSAGASSGTNPVLSTSYDVASHVTGVTLGTYDADAFTFDANTGRMTQYQFTVGATPSTVTGNLGWNANGTLASLGITDQFNSANTQNCTYSYDDLVRISGTNCGSAWSQSFGFDAFGNLTKSGSVSFQPTYSTATNRMSSLPGFTPTYDANGNTTADSLHAYAWDADGNSITIDTLGLTFDALDRMVEQQNGSSYTQILYGPTGKLALMNGQSVTKAFIPLPSGATAVYTSGATLSYFRHPDWLGSSRFASTPNRTMYYSGAYAPFGEAYAEAGTTDRSFTGQNQDTIQGSTTGLYDFLFREHAQYGRWISPDPAGLSAVDPTNPQSWNRYAYVLNNPTGLVDPLGLVGTRWLNCLADITGCSGGGGGGGGGDCTLNGFWTPCEMVGGLVAAGAAIACPNNDCSVFQTTFHGSYGGSFQLVPTANGLIWINAMNGAELSPEAAAEIGLPAAGSFQVYDSPLQGWNSRLAAWTKRARSLLKNPRCAAFFGGKGLSTFQSTTYSPFPMAPDYFAVTLGQTSVGVNPLSWVFQAMPGQTFFSSLRPGGLSAVDAGAVGLLHELSHQLEDITGAVPDRIGPAANGLNSWNTLRVLNACYWRHRCFMADNRGVASVFSRFGRSF